MSHYNKYLFLPLLYCCFFCIHTVSAQSGRCGQNLQWNISDSILTISGQGAMDNMDPIGEVFTPWYSQREDVKKIILSEGVTRIGNFAFLGFSSLEDVSFPTTLSAIGSDAFSGCSRLQNVQCPERLEKIEDYAFSACTSLKSVCECCVRYSVNCFKRRISA